MALALTSDFSAFLKSLASSRVEYLVVGGYAVAHHGYPRVTGDIDVWIRTTPDNATRVVEALTAFGFGVEELTPELFLAPGSLVRMGLPPNRIEILTAISGVTFDACWERRVTDTWDGVPVSILSLDDLKANKRASGRAKDQADLDELP